MDKKYYIIAIVVIIVLVILYAIFSKKKTVTHTGGGSVQQGGIGDLLGGGSGGGILGWLGNIIKGGGAKYKCDCSRPGYTTDGDEKESCKEGRVDYQIDCQ